MNVLNNMKNVLNIKTSDIVGNNSWNRCKTFKILAALLGEYLLLKVAQKTTKSIEN